jgi:hypothetical protein
MVDPFLHLLTYNHSAITENSNWSPTDGLWGVQFLDTFTDVVPRWVDFDHWGIANGKETELGPLRFTSLETAKRFVVNQVTDRFTAIHEVWVAERAMWVAAVELRSARTRALRAAGLWDAENDPLVALPGEPVEPALETDSWRVVHDTEMNAPLFRWDLTPTVGKSLQLVRN